MKEEAGTGCNAARHSHKRAKRGPPLTIEDKKDFGTAGTFGRHGRNLSVLFPANVAFVHAKRGWLRRTREL